ncbi:hypothetical protein BDY17DRAFT_309245 [Neohortaea acidophila]|uniref:Uncharacterized protein n=1 Tax=Neohortaea acidophila TaxID=245834 RepID=A0A6A6PUV0_9PEZI|nr:uncharacterized protein BDY17DRAFT_309245 [Neohortaea acidophila]KAF2483880.1 hypothetical protein BDY17DRAFT_309245 [Neohortaea acidophila]
MPRSQMMTAIAQATILGTLDLVAAEHLYSRALYNLDPAFASTFNYEQPWKEYYMKQLPREVVCLLIVNCLRYVWYIWLERVLPTRPRPKLDMAPKRTASIDNEVEEEKIIADWIAQGRIRRSSMSWCNILTKVLLDLTVANVFFTVVVEISHRAVRLNNRGLSLEGFGMTIALAAVGQLFSLTPPLSLLAFIVSPAHQRIVFEDGVYLVFTVFFALFLGKLGPWLMTFELVQEAWKNGTRAAQEAMANETAGNITFHTLEEL